MKEAGVGSAAGSAAVSGVVLLGGQCAPQPGEPPPGASPEGRNVQILSGELPPNGHAPAQVFGAAPGDHEDTFYHPGPGAMPPPADRTIYGEDKNVRYAVWTSFALGIVLLLIAVLVGATGGDDGFESTGFIVLLIVGLAFVFLYAFLFCVAITILARIDWRQRIAIRRLLLRIGWDKFPALDLFVHVHSVNIFTGPGHNSTTHGAGDKYCVRVWVVSGDASRRSKHRMASRTLDLLETVVARRPFGCIRMEAFALTRKMLADKPGGAATYPPHEYSWKSEAPPPVADAFVSGKVTLSLQYKEDVTKQCSEEITNLERLVEHPVSAPLCAKLMSKHLGVYCGLMTIAAVVTDPRHPNYVCLRYVKSRKEGESVDLYFRILDSPHWIEAMHLFIELIRKLKGQGADRV
eukprot:g15483.t1